MVSRRVAIVATAQTRYEASKSYQHISEMVLEVVDSCE